MDIRKIELEKSCHGYKIRRKDAYNRWLYIASVRNGKASWCTDYVYGKAYKTESGSYKAVQSIMEG